MYIYFQLLSTSLRHWFTTYRERRWCEAASRAVFGGSIGTHISILLIYNKAAWPHYLTHIYYMFIAEVLIGVQTPQLLFYLNSSFRYQSLKTFIKSSNFLLAVTTLAVYLHRIWSLFSLFSKLFVGFRFFGRIINTFIMSKATVHVFSITHMLTTIQYFISFD